MFRELESERRRHQEARENVQWYGLTVIKLHDFEREL